MTTGDSAPRRAGRREWVGLAVLALPTLVLAMDMTVLHLAAPTISAELSPTGGQLLWILDIYGFLVAGFLISMGTLGDRVGRRRLLLVGAAAFAVASVLAAFARSAETLIAARALLGVAGATLMPSTLALISTMFVVPAQRTFAVAVWMTAFISGEAIGPLVGGALLEFFWWGSVFLIAVPVMLLLLVAGPRLLPERRTGRAAGRFDILSAALSTVAVLALVYAVKQLSGAGPGAVPLGWALVGLAVGGGFLRRQRKLDEPLLDLGLFRLPAFSAALGTQTLAVCGLAGTQLLLMQYLQSVVGLSPLAAGLWTLPAVVAGIGGTLLAPRVVARVRPAVVVAGCLLVAAGGAALVTAADEDGPAWAVTGFTVLYVGLTPILALTTDLVVGSAPPERAGAASAISESGAELGLALGMALLGSLGLAVYRQQLSAHAPDAVGDAALHDARETIGGAVSTAEALPEPLGGALLDAARAAFTTGLHATALLTTVALLGAAALAAVTLRGSPPGGREAPGGEPERARAA
ncbi:MFS transporter [Streptomyces sp. DSM 44915]|uniref:MFS transporter n=1 Tax=Streptomyces chisholmiae TaxID=3075540 RepID=A0ABU2JUW1_9ACTN|nr:MFS transporter [Streptomyces sp. DSM 44915]MDT0268757.1 MFS transporter [Streptomyces sp. DSM 44915]